MKPHLIVKVRPGATRLVDRAPFWKDFIRDKRVRIERFHPSVDRLLASYHLPFWVTNEYGSANQRWSSEEVATGLDRVFRLILQRNAALPASLVDQVRLNADFEYVRPIQIATSPVPEPSQPMSLPRFADRSREMIGLREAHLFGAGDSRIKVAILDTGVELTHPEVADRVVAKADFVSLAGLDTTDFIGDILDADDDPVDEVGHGTHVAGIIAARGAQMPRGVAPECSLMVVRTLATMRTEHGRSGAGIVDNINVSIKWAVDNGANVINASLGIRHTGGGLPHEEVIRYALARGVTFVAASGNDGTTEKYYPGALPGVIAVGAADSDGNVADFTSFGAPVWLHAPGTDIFSSYAGGRYERATGTSQAAPFVAGAVALLKSQALRRDAVLTDDDVKAILKHTSDKPDRAERTPRGGYGRLNVLDACRLLNHLLDDNRLSRLRAA